MKWTIEYRKDDVVVSNDGGLREVYKPDEIPLYLPNHPINDTVDVIGEFEHLPDSEKIRLMTQDVLSFRAKKLAKQLSAALGMMGQKECETG